MHRNTYMTINIANFIYNLNYLKKTASKNIIPVIKANAYGTCDYYIAEQLLKQGISLVAVSSIDEALNLRRHNINCDILILGYVKKEDLKLVKAYNFSIITSTEDDIFSLNEQELNHIKFHIKIDSGMHRLGIQADNVKKIFEHLKANGAVIEGIMTHFACSDQKGQLVTKQQYQVFKKAVTSINHNFKYIHCSNTDAAIDFHEDLSTHIRTGLGLWGYTSHESDLKPVLALYSEISNWRKLKDGEHLGYGYRYTSDGQGYIGVIPIGYADGLSRLNSNRTVYINNHKATIVGNICMDQCFIHSNEKLSFGDRVEIFGPNIKLDKMAKELNTIPYEIITTISDRVNRSFIDEKGHEIFSYCPRFDK